MHLIHSWWMDGRALLVWCQSFTVYSKPIRVSPLQFLLHRGWGTAAADPSSHSSMYKDMQLFFIFHFSWILLSRIVLLLLVSNLILPMGCVHIVWRCWPLLSFLDCMYGGVAAFILVLNFTHPFRLFLFRTENSWDPHAPKCFHQERRLYSVGPHLNWGHLAAGGWALTIWWKCAPQIFMYTRYSSNAI